ncbi:hypothetical protein DFH28DRAFT_1081068 [Melampsora americana]|nr:hypothetical protein DFH28DRAFT_1081068 [Melampsora americana]
MWSEWLSELLGNDAEVKNYAISGATIDKTLWHSANKSSDMAMEIDRFLCQNHQLDPSSSIASLFFGNNDFFLFETQRLISFGLKNFLILTPAFENSKVKEFNQIIWNGLKSFKTQDSNLQFITVNLSNLFHAIKSSPQNFGYHSIDSCLPKSSNMNEVCKDPEYRLYWIFWHPQTLTHKLQADYIKLIAESCQLKPDRSSIDMISKGDSTPSSQISSNSNPLFNSNDSLNCDEVDLVQHPPKCL